MQAFSILAADIGITALWLLYAWLASAIISGELAKRKGYTEKLGLGTGMVLSAVAVLIWLLMPRKKD